MGLNMPNIFAYGGLFKISPEDDQGLLYQGNRNLPGSISGADGVSGADGTDGVGFDFLINDTFDSVVSAGLWDQFTSGGSVSAGSGVLGCDASNTSGNHAGLISDDAYAFTTRPYLVCEFNSLFESDGIGTTEQMIGVAGAQIVPIKPVDGIGIFHDSEAYAAYLTCIKDGTETSGSYYSAGIFDSTYTHHRLEMSSGAVKWFVNGVLADTITSNIPDDANLKGYIRADCIWTSGATSNRVRLRDYTLWNDRN